jgi:hypothetical protein
MMRREVRKMVMFRGGVARQIDGYERQCRGEIDVYEKIVR